MFCPARRTRNLFVIGTVKGLEYVYGIDILLKAAHIVHIQRPDIPLRIRIAGKGSKAEEYAKLAEELGIADIVNWLGFISQEWAAKEWANMDVAVIPSRQESFGVSSVEAQACGCPVIISDIPGLMEATFPGKTSVAVERNNEQLLADTIIELFDNKELRYSLGNQGRIYVEEKYEVQQCFENVEKIFEEINAKK